MKRVAKLCKGRIRAIGGRSIPCPNRATQPDGHCGTHSPAAIEAREQRRDAKRRANLDKSNELARTYTARREKEMARRVADETLGRLIRESVAHIVSSSYAHFAIENTAGHATYHTPECVYLQSPYKPCGCAWAERKQAIVAALKAALEVTSE